MTLRAELIMPGDPVVPGERIMADLLICNDGHIVDAYDLDLLGLPGEWDTRRLGRVVVFPGTSEQISIPLAPPRSSETAPGTLPFGVKVVSAENRELTAVPEAELSVGEFWDLDAGLARKTVKGRIGAAQFVTLHNTGNATAHLRVRCAPDEDSAPVRTRIRRTRIVLRAGERARIGVDMANTKPRLWGEPESCAMRLQVDWDAQGRREFGFTYERGPFLTKKTVKVLSALAAMTVAGAALWLSPLGGKAEPRTQSLGGASQQAQQQKAESDRQQAEKKREAAADKKQAEQERKEEEKGAPQQKTLQQPLNARSPDGTASDTYRVPQGYELRLTGVNITAAGPARGSWQLSADQGALATGGMAEPHQQTWKDSPYVVSAGKSLKLSVDCTTEKTGAVRLRRSPSPSVDDASPDAASPNTPSADAPSACAATALLDGMLVPKKGPFASPLPHPIA
ncbi:hypothetical protein ACIBKX_32990 [Streptomyces sp. NPDC050658]|uniref:COG1470 family protein n=1 Tax=unclassified Streptomyces TaxID=2593676 RepID=UPI003427C289